MSPFWQWACGILGIILLCIAHFVWGYFYGKKHPTLPTLLTEIESKVEGAVKGKSKG